MADIDPYAILGVPKDATLPEIKSAHRKLVLKCHPDKIKDESLRNQAQDEFQRVQQAYETLSDPSRRTKHDQKVRLAELRREMKEQQDRSQARTSTAREFRDGRIYEERTPAFGDDDDLDDDEDTVPDEPRAPNHRKHDDWGSGRRTARADERKKPPSSTPKGASSTGSPFAGFRTTRERDSSRTYHTGRAKYRTKERRREAYEKYTPYVESEDSDSGSASSIYERVKRSATESRRATPDRPRASAAAHSPIEEDDLSDPSGSKYNILESTAQDYIRRSGGNPPAGVDAHHRPSRSPSGPRDYESRRSKRSSRETVRPSNSRSGSFEHLGVPPPRLSKEATSPVPGKYGSRPGHPSRSATSAAAFGRSGPKRQDSGYSSPGTPDMAHGTSPPKSSGTPRFKVVTVDPDTVPPLSSPRYQQRGYSPPHPSRGKPSRSKTTFAPESSSSRTSRPVPPSATKGLFGEIDPKDIKYAREYGPEDYPLRAEPPYHHPPQRSYSYQPSSTSPGRRQSAYA